MWSAEDDSVHIPENDEVVAIFSRERLKFKGYAVRVRVELIFAR